MNEKFRQLQTGTWRVCLQTPGGELPFLMELYQEGEKCMVDLINGDEQLSTDEVEENGADISIKLAVFNAQLKATLEEDGSKMNGYWYDYSRGNDYFLPFSAQLDATYRFSEHPHEPSINVDGKWKTTFLNEEGESSNAIGVFEQSGNHLSGTFLTPTGDFRFLEGEVDGANFRLSAFDGAHAFLITGQKIGETLTGAFYSGNHWKETFTANRDPYFTLPDPTELTYLIEGEPFAFSFPDEEGNLISLHDSRFQNKPVIVQIMATWCPNCMDETALLAEMYRRYHKEDLQIVAIAFERETNHDAVKRNFDRLRRRFGIEYPLLLGGNSSKKAASAAFPMLNSVIAFPTTLVIDHMGRNRLLYTGFNGPATGEIHLQFKKEFTRLIEGLL
jgi:thiol-disulfide isomerase/thioredoxin